MRCAVGERCGKCSVSCISLGAQWTNKHLTVLCREKQVREMWGRGWGVNEWFLAEQRSLGGEDGNFIFRPMTRLVFFSGFLIECSLALGLQKRQRRFMSFIILQILQ
jgi:hypothetical protein